MAPSNKTILAIIEKFHRTGSLVSREGNNWVPEDRHHKLESSTAVGQAAACTSVTKWVRVRSSVGTGFLGEVSLGVFPHL